MLRNVLRVTNSVISGSSALHFLDVDRAPLWSATDLDIYTPIHCARQIVNYLCNVEGYHIVQEPVPSKYPHLRSGFATVFHLRRDLSEIDVIQSCTRSALYPIPYFWGTHVMNYLTADTFCVAYPEYTLEGKSLLNPVALVDKQHPNVRMLTNMDKYTERGYAFRKLVPVSFSSRALYDIILFR
ncbi:hypothetical protein GY45DRAFT_1342100 [Cubamyces sp. BRFM 1775]|nr:hypothetical protein GY45DRAFT_1342100 [Cubamyces sp. BRFM 1775]